MNLPHPTLQQTLMNILAFHKGQVDKSGVPYFNHPVRVMLRLGACATDPERHAALLHDVIEDTPITIEILRDMGYGEDVLAMVDLMTRPESVTHRQYIYNIIGSGNHGAMRIKLADLYDNSSLVRRERITDLELRKKLDSMVEQRYEPAIRFMLAAVENAESVLSDEMEVELDMGERDGEA